MKRPSGKLGVWLVLLVAIIILVAGVVLVFSSAQLQQKLLSNAPEYDATTLYSRGVEQSLKGDYQAAEASLEQALKKQDDATYRGQLAVVKYRLKKYEASIELYQKLISEGKDAAFAWNGIGNAERDWAEVDTANSDKHYAAAVEAYEKSISLNPQYVAAYSNLALLWESQSEKTKAIEVLDRGIAATSARELSEIRTRMLQN